MSADQYPRSVGNDSPASNRRVPTARDHIPRGYRPDFDAPSAFVVRCSEHGRLIVDDSRGQAHRRASQHALTCEGCAGVTPISAVETPDDPEADDDLDLEPGALDPRRVDLTGNDVSVTYRSVQGASNQQRRCVNVERMLPADLEHERRYWRGFEATAENGATLRVTADGDDPAVEVCYDDACRVIGTLDSVRADCTATGAPVATDGGNR